MKKFELKNYRDNCWVSIDIPVKNHKLIFKSMRDLGIYDTSYGLYSQPNGKGTPRKKMWTNMYYQKNEKMTIRYIIRWSEPFVKKRGSWLDHTYCELLKDSKQIDKKMTSNDLILFYYK